MPLAVPENTAELTHILDVYQQQGTQDDVWVPYIARGGFIVVSGDLGRSGGPKLPKLCVQYGVTHVLLSPAMGSRKSLEKLLSILSVWYELLALANESPGSRFQLEPNGSGKGKLIKKALPTPPADPPAPKDMLFSK